MPTALPELCKTTTTTTGNNDYVLATANLTTAHRTPKQAVTDGSLSDGDRVLYMCRDSTVTGDASFEKGWGTYATNTVSRSAADVVDGSNGPGALVSWPGSGTRDFYLLGFAPQASSQTSANNSLVVASDGDIGLGTALPQAALDIAGAGAALMFSGTSGGGGESISYEDSGGSSRTALLFPGSDVVAVTNRASNGVVQIRANTATAGSGGEVTAIVVEDDEVQLLPSGGNVGIGTADPACELHTLGSGTPITPDSAAVAVFQNTNATSTQSAIQIAAGNQANAAIYFGDPDDDTIGAFLYSNNANSFTTRVNNGVAIFIDSSQQTAFGNITANERVTVDGAVSITDGMTAPSATSGYAKIFVDSADGDLKVIFGNGTVTTIATD